MMERSGASPDGDRVADALAAGRAVIRDATRVVVFSGAGLSAESGVSTFRDPPTGGLWSKYDPMTLASPQGFAQDPEAVLSWYGFRRRQIADASPNPAHAALAAASARGRATLITQNTDNLLERAGASGVLHLHGVIDHDRCDGGCGHREPIELSDPPGRRACPACGGAMRPAVVWFGESLPPDVWAEAERASRDADVMLVVGTTAQVYPAAGLIAIAKQSGARIIIVNPNASDASGLADVEASVPASVGVPALLA